jgi:hypothetical protein
MPIDLSFLPTLAALSSESATMRKNGLDDITHEATLTSILGASELELSGVGGPDEGEAEAVMADSMGESAEAQSSLSFPVGTSGNEAVASSFIGFPEGTFGASPAVLAVADTQQAASAGVPVVTAMASASAPADEVVGGGPNAETLPDGFTPSFPPGTVPDSAVQTPDVVVSPGVSAEGALLDGRRRPGDEKTLPDPVVQTNIGAVRPPPPSAFPGDPEFPIPDRFRLSSNLGLARKEKFLDPYNQNTFKGDKPLCIPTDEEVARRAAAGESKCRTPKFLGLKGDDWFFVLTGISDTIVEPRTFPIPVSVQTTERPRSNDVFGKNQSLVLAQTFLFGAALIKGQTAYKPPDVEYRALLAFNINYVNVPERRVLSVKPSKESNRFDYFLGVQELFYDVHWRNVSDRYDFDSFRFGIQPFQQDFRGFLFNDNQLGVRLFGIRDNNRFQYNLAAFWRLEKDTNSGLNAVTMRPRDDYVIAANVYRQDFPVVGLTSQVSVTLNINREKKQLELDDNGFPVRPALLGDNRGRNYDVTYLGYSVDGRIGRLNLTATSYAALGTDRNSFFTSQKAKIRSFFFAAEPSIDINYLRIRLAALYASGDSKPFDNVEGGFDAIFENPIFAGADTSYFIRQTIPFAGGGRVININGRNGILNSLRSSKEQGQSNFNNPGTMLLGVGVDADISPTFRLTGNVNHLWFENTATLQALRVEGSIPKAIGYDISAAAIFRPTAIQNVVFRLSGAVLQSGKGFRDLFANAQREKRYYSVLFNATASF